ncbi:hypothetical protein IAR55_001165 [Kwoniella newhampshirensis]|uniref:Uncharacterized protein n=1 Tax=Kwoniella newhampshirensis TaxID=1651941 RepID=A0AAW0Z4W9_9TREE
MTTLSGSRTTVTVSCSVFVLLLGLAFPRSKLIQTVLFTPIYISAALFVAIVAVLASALRSDRLGSASPDPATRQRHALRRLRFTTPAAWSAVLTRQSWEDHPSAFSPIHPSASPQLNSRLDAVLRLVKVHFILPWYERISPSPAFPYAVEGIIRHAMRDMARRAEAVDWPTVMVSKVLPLVKDHLQHYRSIEHLSSTSTAGSLPNPALPLPLPIKAHPALSDQSHVPSGGAISLSVEAHLRESLARILGDILPEKDQSEVVCIVVREIVLGSALLPVFDMLCESDFWNRQIDERGGRYLYEQKQVDKFLSALSNLPIPSSASTSTPSKSKPPRNANISTTSISSDSSTRQFDTFLKSIGKLKTLGDARRLRADVERELRSAKLAHAEESRKGRVGKDAERRLRRVRRYVERLERAKGDIDVRIGVLSGQQGKVLHPGEKPSKGSPDIESENGAINLYQILSDPSSLAYWLEHMERRGRSRLVQFWLTVEGFKDPLEAAGLDSALDSIVRPIAPSASGADQTTGEDVTLLYEMYFAADESGVDIPVKHRQIIEHTAQSPATLLSPIEIQTVKHAVFSSQKAVYEQMLEEDWSPFMKSELFVKAIADLRRGYVLLPRAAVPEPENTMTPTISSTPLSPPSLPPRPPLTPKESSKALLDLLSPTSRPRLPIKQGSFTPVSAVIPATSISVTPPVFERASTDFKPPSSKELRKVSASEFDRESSNPSSGPLTPPPVPRRSSQLDFLISDGGDTAVRDEDRGKLFSDDDEMDEADEDEYMEVKRMEAIQAALNEIIASDNDAAKRQSPPTQTVTPKSLSSSMSLFKDTPLIAEERSRNLSSRSLEDMRIHKPFRTISSAPASRMPSTAINRSSTDPPNQASSLLSPSVDKSNRVLFDDEVIDEDVVGSEDEQIDQDVRDVIQLAAPGDLQLAIEIARLQDKIQELVQQDHLLDTLIRQAELTGNQSELRILRRSRSSVRREQRTAIFQKAQFEQQEEENRLVPGRTRVTIPTSVITTEDGDSGKQVVRYTIEVTQVSEEGRLGPGWVVARRYNEFWELDKALRDWAATKGDQALMEQLKHGVVEMPGKKLVPNMSASFVESRRNGLERYLQSLLSSLAICDSHLLRSFLSRSPVPIKSGDETNSDAMTSSTGALFSLAPHNIVKSLYKTMATSIDDAMLGPSMLDLMYSTLNRQLNDFGGLVGLGGEELAGFLPQSLKTGVYTPQWLKTDPMESATGSVPRAGLGAGGGSAIHALGGESGMTSFTGPICDLFIEIFDLKENNWLRRQAIVVILQQFLGSTIERKVRDTFRTASTPDSFERILSGLEVTLFPGGERRPPSAPRTEQEMSETRVRASKKLGLLIPDIAANMIGKGNARRAARRVFGALQDKRLNQHLVLSILDEILNTMFPPHRGKR